MTDRGPWMHVYSGGRFYPLDPRPDEIRIQDIAHALSLICRYQGHASRFYSVAEHCLLMAEAAHQRGLSEAEQLQALLHDAAETYLCDVVRPIKSRLSGYHEIEYRLEGVIAERFGLLAPGKTPAVDALDSLILYDEAKALLRVDREPWHDLYAPGLEIHGGRPIVGLIPRDAEVLFLQVFRRYRPDWSD